VGCLTWAGGKNNAQSQTHRHGQNLSCHFGNFPSLKVIQTIVTKEVGRRQPPLLSFVIYSDMLSKSQ
jgi:hypothetical protein